MQNGMEARTSIPHAGPDRHAHMAADFRKRFCISPILTLPVLALSPMLQTLAELREAIRFPGDVYVLFGFSSAIFWYGGWPFPKGFVEELKSRRPGMMTLISVAIVNSTPYPTVSSTMALSLHHGGWIDGPSGGCRMSSFRTYFPAIARG